jgi:leucyl aminopeptidase
MSVMPSIAFTAFGAPATKSVAVLAQPNLALGAQAKALDKELGGQLIRGAGIAGFIGARKSAMQLLAPNGSGLDRVLAIGCGDAENPGEQSWAEVGGYAYSQLAAKKTDAATLVAEVAGSVLSPDAVAALGMGALLRSYTFRKFKTKAKPGENGGEGLNKLTIQCKDPDKATTAFKRAKAIAEGVFIARDLVNEPANTLGPVEFAAEAEKLAKVGVTVEVLDVDQMTELKMHALLAVGQGSVRPSRMVIMQWHGADKKSAKPVAFIGKGVVFDTGGISMKPAKGMEDMKGDMAGAACVTGLMHALAARKAPVNAVGIIGIVENMPSGNAMRPGDIIGSMSGQTIEVLNTDAEGRLVLADCLHYCQERFKPKAMVNLATLTGAIMAALGKEYAGLFSNNDKLATWLAEAGEATGERLWRMPMDPAYDKEIDSKNADMKNIGGQYGGAITAAQFLKRFVGDVPWAHLDIAGVALASNKSEISESWSSGYGVRLLDRLVSDRYEG